MRPRDLIELALLSILWGGAYLFMRAAVPAFGPGPMVALRIGIAAALLLPLLALRRGMGTLLARRRELLVQGLLYTALPFMLLGHAAAGLTAAQAAVLNATSPLFTAIIVHFAGGERITRPRAAGLVVGFAGVVVLVWGRLGFDTGGIGPAVLAVLGAASLWGFGGNYTRRHLAGVDPVVTSAGSLLVAAVVLAPVGIAAWPAQPPGVRAWAEVVFLGVASTGIGLLMYFRLLRNVGPVRAISVTFLNPLVAMISGAIYLGEAITLQLVAGCAVILLGTALTLGLVGGPGGRPAPHPAGPQRGSAPAHPFTNRGDPCD